MAHPYLTKPDYCFWRRAVSSIAMDQVDPVVKSKFFIQRSDRIATAGSCFAQHIARHLSESGFNYFVTEELNPFIPEYIAPDYNFGVFSARYGNLYTTRQFLQLLKRAYGMFTPTDNIWAGEDGRYYDPYRPQIQPRGFSSEREYQLDREQHFASIRRMVEECDIFVFTLGLTEAWLNQDDGAVYPICPGTAAGTFNPAKHKFINFRMMEVLEDMTEALNLFRAKNNRVRFILTVSPVALLATAEDRHVLVSTTHSKSILRSVCGELDEDFDDIAYFPSYEIITGSFNRGAYFAEDLRDVTELGVTHVMRLFMKHYASVEEHRISPQPKHQSESAREVVSSLARGIDQAVKVICDEEALDR